MQDRQEGDLRRRVVLGGAVAALVAFVAAAFFLADPPGVLRDLASNGSGTGSAERGSSSGDEYEARTSGTVREQTGQASGATRSRAETTSSRTGDGEPTPVLTAGARDQSGGYKPTGGW